MRGNYQKKKKLLGINTGYIFRKKNETESELFFIGLFVGDTINVLCEKQGSY